MSVPETARRWPDYASVWRWHFYAGLFCVPFVLWLSLTGAIYLFRPQVEAWIDRPYMALPLTGPVASPSAQAAAAVKAVPGSVLHRYELPEAPNDAAQVIVGKGGVETRVYLDPQTLRVLKTVNEDDRLMRVVFRLHGELLAGTIGSYTVELAASWTIVMILSGLFLWWPRGGGMAGVVYPRLRSGGRRFWRDLHGVTGFWVSAMALFLLLSGLPWAKSWGGYLASVRGVVEGHPVKQDWSTSHAEELKARAAADAGTRMMMGEHAEHDGMAMAHPMGSYAPLDRLVATVRPLALAAPVLIAPPTGMGQPWTAKSDAADRPQRTDLALDGATGRILSRKDFAQRRLVDRIVGYGVAVHEGQLFGWLNQLLNLVTALGLILLSVSSVVMWWRRRPDGKLGAPIARVRAPVAIGFFAVLIALGLFLPLLGVAMIAVLLTERLVLRRMPIARVWLGLRPA
ncbi:PepSY-associated TM helix domain-containing protein [Sphingomonas immobilis]|uniref:PepSY domain-containing protein n=1 Tax=Sphingomonas immobilis TaxID=3063997 RepID=A0ABT9A045_9SPHN|nr:PepSY domain-containing protein [Sphingomonas sp. CA1-15]MDO7843208.1 PepSY domain-containing protein [Sphingomonas sp. CA1-15]